MDEVLAAQVLHAAGDVRHELHQHLRWKELQHITAEETHISVTPLPAEGGDAHVKTLQSSVRTGLRF